MAEIYFFMVLCALTLLADDVYSECKLPEKVRGTWYSYEKGNNTYTNITKAGMSINQGDMIPCVDLEKINNNDYLAIFKNGSCYSCMQIFVRHLNIVQKHVGPCKTLAEGETASTDTLCDKSGAYVKLDTLFYQDRTGADSARTAVSCKPYLEGAWRYRYARPLKFTRICDAPGSTLHACQSPDEHHKNVKFHVNMKTCRGYPHSYELDDDFACIGGWYIGKQLFFAIYNTKDASDDQKYRCLAKYPQNHTILGMSDIPDCNELAYINDPAEVFFLTPLQTEPIPSYCTLPEAFVGEYLDTANAYADVTINYTHIVETEEIDGIEKTVVYSCQELRGDTVVVARKTVEGCGPDYVCIQFLHNDTNVIRYNKGEPTSAREYEKVCGSPRKDSGRFEYFVKKNSNPVTCPFQGRYKFTQVGNYPLKKRIIENVGITLPPLPGTSCKETISNFEVTNSTENKISITLDYCVRVDGSGKPVLNFQDPDLEVRCISNWQENNNSYVITYDQFITPRVYYCWLYENINENQIRITLSERACYKNQTSVNSYGAEVALELQKYEYGQ